MTPVVITGGTGQIGAILSRHFGSRAVFMGRGSLPDWPRHIDGAEIVINLAGRSVNCRYTQANRREIRDSRIQTTEMVARAIADAKYPPGLWINASTATIYRHALDRPMDEHTGEIGVSPDKRIPGLKPAHPRQLALMDALVRFANVAAGQGFRSVDIYPAALQALEAKPSHYTLASLRYDL